MKGLSRHERRRLDREAVSRGKRHAPWTPYEVSAYRLWCDREGRIIEASDVWALRESVRYDADREDNP